MSLRHEQSFPVRRRTFVFDQEFAVNIHTFARAFGIIFLIVGIGGFIPGLTQPHDHPNLAVEAGSGMELGLFPVNVLHNLVHILFGVWGIAMYRSFSGSLVFARGVAIIYAVLATWDCYRRRSAPCSASCRFTGTTCGCTQ